MADRGLTPDRREPQIEEEVMARADGISQRFREYSKDPGNWGGRREVMSVRSKVSVTLLYLKSSFRRVRSEKFADGDADTIESVNTQARLANSLVITQVERDVAAFNKQDEQNIIDALLKFYTLVTDTRRAISQMSSSNDGTRPVSFIAFNTALEAAEKFADELEKLQVAPEEQVVPSKDLKR